MSVGNPHIGKSDFRGSMSIWIHLIAPARPAYCGMNGTSESSSRPRSAASSKGSGSKPAKHGECLRNIEVDRIEFGDPDAAGLRQPVQHRDRPRLAAEIGRQRNRIFRSHQLLGDRIDPRRLDASGVNAAISRGRIGRHVGVVPLFRQRFARKHHVDGAGRIALRKRAGAGQRLLHDDARRQANIPT